MTNLHNAHLTSKPPPLHPGLPGTSTLVRQIDQHNIRIVS